MSYSVKALQEGRAAHTAIVASGGWIVACAVENESGYYPLTYGPYEEESDAQSIADRINATWGISPRRALLIVLSSMHPLAKAEHEKRRKEWPA